VVRVWNISGHSCDPMPCMAFMKSLWGAEHGSIASVLRYSKVSYKAQKRGREKCVISSVGQSHSEQATTQDSQFNTFKTVYNHQCYRMKMHGCDIVKETIGK
jgi:hypothetical protein